MNSSVVDSHRRCEDAAEKAERLTAELADLRIALIDALCRDDSPMKAPRPSGTDDVRRISDVVVTILREAPDLALAGISGSWTPYIVSSAARKGLAKGTEARGMLDAWLRSRATKLGWIERTTVAWSEAAKIAEGLYVYSSAIRDGGSPAPLDLDGVNARLGGLDATWRKLSTATEGWRKQQRVYGAAQANSGRAYSGELGEVRLLRSVLAGKPARPRGTRRQAVPHAWVRAGGNHNRTLHNDPNCSAMPATGEVSAISETRMRANLGAGFTWCGNCARDRRER